MQVILPNKYRPSKREAYMNPKQLEYFRQKLLRWRQDLITESEKTLIKLVQEKDREAEEIEQSVLEFETGLELRTRDRYRKLIRKIDHALERIDGEEYGYCEETGEPIGLGRLEARPVATLCIEAQEQHEQFERQTKAVNYY
jgi:RNA polymerase-binding transcription factor